MASLASLILERIAEQDSSCPRKEGNVFRGGENILPPMQEVGDWSQSGTGLLDHRALRLLQSVPATELGHLCARNPEPLMHVTSIGELAMHSADDKAKQLHAHYFKRIPTWNVC